VFDTRFLPFYTTCAIRFTCQKSNNRLVDEYTKASAKKEARGRVIDSLHREAMMWMDRFAFTLNGNHEHPRLLAKAKVMVDMYLAPEEIHGLLNYC